MQRAHDALLTRFCQFAGSLQSLLGPDSQLFRIECHDEFLPAVEMWFRRPVRLTNGAQNVHHVRRTAQPGRTDRTGRPRHDPAPGWLPEISGRRLPTPGSNRTPPRRRNLRPPSERERPRRRPSGSVSHPFSRTRRRSHRRPNRLRMLPRPPRPVRLLRQPVPQPPRAGTAPGRPATVLRWHC